MTSSMNRLTGTALSGEDYDAQCIMDLLSTPMGTRVMRLDYGWVGFEILDQPINRATTLLLTSAAVMAMRRWLPKLKVTKVTISGDLVSGKAAMTITRKVSTAATNSLASQTIPLTR